MLGMKYHHSHPAISNYSEDIVDYILLELASQFSIRAGQGSEWSVPKCYAYLKEKYREDSKLDIQTLAPKAQTVLVELRFTLLIVDHFHQEKYLSISTGNLGACYIEATHRWAGSCRLSFRKR